MTPRYIIAFFALMFAMVAEGFTILSGQESTIGGILIGAGAATTFWLLGFGEDDPKEEDRPEA